MEELSPDFHPLQEQDQDHDQDHDQERDQEQYECAFKLCAE